MQREVSGNIQNTIVMDDNYIVTHLKSMANFLYGRTDCFAKKVGKYYQFGYEDDSTICAQRVDRKFAIVIITCAVRLEEFEKIKKLRTRGNK